MPKIHVVTDSCARFFTSHFVQQNPVTVVPNTLRINDKLYREDVDLSTEEALNLMGKLDVPPQLISPSTADYMAVYQRLARSNDAIISIHGSREVFSSWQNARSAAQQMAGHCEIVVIDSQSMCMAQGMLVMAAVKAIREQQPLDDIVRLVRGAVDRVYSIYCLESLDFIMHNRIFSPSHSILGDMLGIKPIVTVENGQIAVIEKVRTRAQVVDQLVDFAIEFEDIEETVIVQNRPHMTEQTRILHDRLTTEFPRLHFPYSMYGATLAALIGTDATGIVILEHEIQDYIGDDYGDDDDD